VPEDLLAMVGATGAAVLEDGRCTRIGTSPSEELVREFAAWMAREKHEVLASRSVSVEFPAAPALGPEIAGVLALGLPQTAENAVIWFRPAIVETVSWAGSPEKTYSVGPNGPSLNPRGSFALWKETVENQSERWSPLEVNAAAELRAGLAEVTIRKVREAEHSRDMLLGMVSHDLRNPLGAIRLAAEMLQTGEAEASSVTRASARIAASSDRMRRMIEQLLDYTRTQAGTLQLSIREIDLVTLCRELAEEIEGAHPGFRVDLVLPESCPFACDPDRIAQVVSNLLGNARNHGDPARPASLALRCLENEVVIEIRNQGPSIPSDRLSTLFEPFKRNREMARASRYSGLGLGLFIVKRLVELHRGSVGISSSDEHGTVCTVTLPRPSHEAVSSD
jgi:two-component system, chemotaxis family, sensor kinase Cph1